MDCITLSRFILEQGKDPNVTIMMGSIQLACKVIAGAVRKAGIAGLYGLDGSTNATGDDVKKLDIIANDTFVNSLLHSRNLSVMVSEENPEPIIVEEHLAGKYCIAFDPLDGSSNIDCNVSTGTIYGIYEKDNVGPGSISDVLLPGTHLVAAGYCMYGSSTQLVLTMGNGVHAFTLDPSIGEFILTASNLRIPDKPKTIYSINEGNYTLWSDPVKQFVDECKNAQPKPYSARYVGSMVSDVHRTIMYGGIFMYPADSKSTSGKLRLLYEGNPMAMIMEQAGGRGITGTQRILDVVPTQIHERVPVFLGCARDVDRVEAIIREHAAAAGEPQPKKARTDE